MREPWWHDYYKVSRLASKISAGVAWGGAWIGIGIFLSAIAMADVLTP